MYIYVPQSIKILLLGIQMEIQNAECCLETFTLLLCSGLAVGNLVQL